MHVRKITKEGRVNIPIEIMKKFDLKENDKVVIEDNDEFITMKKYSDCYTCAITGKVFKDALIIKIGDVFVSPEGLRQVENYLNEHHKR